MPFAIFLNAFCYFQLLSVYWGVDFNAPKYVLLGSIPEEGLGKFHGKPAIRLTFVTFNRGFKLLLLIYSN